MFAASGREPSDAELHAYLDGTLDVNYGIKGLGALRQFTQYVASLDQARIEEGEALASLLPADSSSSPESIHDSIAREELRSFSRDVLGQLEQKDLRLARVIRMRTGLETGESMTLEAIGEALSISKERVRQLEVRALAKIRGIIRQDSKLRRFADAIQDNHI
jgi:DNA-directed RNA polymerase sigma subunit (sigma70/sigma32)